MRLVPLPAQSAFPIVWYIQHTINECEEHTRKSTVSTQIPLSEWTIPLSYVPTQITDYYERNR